MSSSGAKVALLGRIRGLSIQIADVDDDIVQALAELSMLQHLADDALRDAVVTGNYDDRADAKMTSADVVRCKKRIDGLESDRAKLVKRRDRLIVRLANR